MRTGRGHRDYRDISLLPQVYALLSRSLNARDYGNPFISWSNALRQPDKLLREADKLQRIHESTKGFQNFCTRYLARLMFRSKAHILLRR